MSEALKNIKAERVLTSGWRPKADGYLPLRVVLWVRAKENCRFPEAPYGTHYEVHREDGKLALWHGHYDLTEQGALKDFVARCQDSGCPDVIGKYVALGERATGEGAEDD